MTNWWRTFCMIGSQVSAMLCSFVEDLLRHNNAGNSLFYLSGIWPGCYRSSSFSCWFSNITLLFGQRRTALPHIPCSLKHGDALCELRLYKVSFVITDAIIAPMLQTPSTMPQRHPVYTGYLRTIAPSAHSIWATIASAIKDTIQEINVFNCVQKRWYFR